MDQTRRARWTWRDESEEGRVEGASVAQEGLEVIMCVCPCAAHLKKDSNRQFMFSNFPFD